MDTADVSYMFVNYPGALHSFTNPGADAKAEEFGLPVKYDADADSKSWEQMKTLFEEAL